MKIITMKVVILGDPEVGKTALLSRYVRNAFREYYLPTLGSEFTITEKKIRDGTEIHLHFWDLAGSGSFAVMRRYYLHGANAALICFALDKPASFHGVEAWKNDLDHVRSGAIPIILVGCKSDVTPEVDHDLIDAFCVRNSVLFVKTSARTGENVHRLFSRLIDMVRD
nr:Rab family GTPase [Candidatus Sigynarchaeota archaeon]